MRGFKSHFARQKQRTEDYLRRANGLEADSYGLKLAAIRCNANRTPQVVFSCFGLLLDDPDLDLRVYIGMQPDGYAVDSESPNRVVQLDLPFLDLEALRLKLVRDIG